MTKIECLEKMVKLWNYLATHPEQTKESGYEALDLAPDRESCPCCEYVFTQDHYIACMACPLKRFWVGGFCAAKESAFRIWRDTNSLSVKSYNAGVIALEAQRLLTINQEGAEG